MSTQIDGFALVASTGALARNWWAFGLRGALAIIFGLVALFMPGVTMLSLVLAFAIYAAIDGILAIVGSVRAVAHHERWGILLLEGIVDLLAAVGAFLWPGLTLIAFVGILAGWSLVTGFLEIGAAFRLSGEHGRGWLFLGGIASILYGVALIVAPLIGAVVVTWWLGAYAIIFGVSLIVLAFRLRSATQ